MAGCLTRNLVKNSLSKNFFNEICFKSHVRLTSKFPAALGAPDPASENLVKKKFAALMLWYEEITGMDEVRRAQNRVLEAETNFVAAQERRREASKEVAVVQTKLKDLHGELEKATRGEKRFVELITSELQIIQHERRLTAEFSRYEREERDCFSTLSTAVKDSHEKERAQAEKTKYWSIIGSIVGTVIGIFGSSINNEMKMKQLRKLVKDSVAMKTDSSGLPEALSKHERELSVLVSEIKNATKQPDDLVIGQLNKIIHNLDNKPDLRNTDEDWLKNLHGILKNQEDLTNRQFAELKSLLRTQYALPEATGDQLLIMPTGLEERLYEQYRNTQFVIICSAVTAIAISLVCRFSL